MFRISRENEEKSETGFPELRPTSPLRCFLNRENGRMSNISGIKNSWQILWDGPIGKLARQQSGSGDVKNEKRKNKPFG